MTKTVLAGLLGLLAVAVAVALLTGNDDERLPSYGEVEVSGQPLPPLTEEGDPALGSPAPELAGSDFDGTPVEVRHGRQPHAIVFLAHWCPGCQQEVPAVQGWIEQEGGTPAGVTVRSVITGTDPARPNFPPSAWLQREGWSVPAILDDESHSAGQAFGLHAYPYWVFLDADGNVLGRRAGVIQTEELEQIFAQLAAGA